jgi:hypothetical protein
VLLRGEEQARDSAHPDHDRGSVRENTIAALGALASACANKEAIREAGGIPLLVRELQPSCEPCLDDEEAAQREEVGVGRRAGLSSPLTP